MIKKIIVSPPTGIIFLINVFIVLTSLVPGLKQLLPQVDFLKLEILILLNFLYVAFVLTELSDRLSGRLNDVKGALRAHASVELLSEEEFYNRLLFLISDHAHANVNITYMDCHEPRLSTTYKKQYYKKIIPIIKNRPNVRFRRLIRNTGENLIWVKRLAKQLEGRANFSLRVYDYLDKTSREIPVISVQLIDNRFTFLVAVGEQTASEARRDVLIDSEGLAKKFTKYYDKIWDEGIKIMEEGEIVESGFEDAVKKIDESE